mmetsp:Transcript_85529/g.275956  ORF Transcript_85529/g.275956 Transcript_85529/m.275956 type:complete len:209 (+) Transcript_85529:1252-1878(+)
MHRLSPGLASLAAVEGAAGPPRLAARGGLAPPPPPPWPPAAPCRGARTAVRRPRRGDDGAEGGPAAALAAARAASLPASRRAGAHASCLEILGLPPRQAVGAKACGCIRESPRSTEAVVTEMREGLVRCGHTIHRTAGSGSLPPGDVKSPPPPRDACLACALQDGVEGSGLLCSPRGTRSPAALARGGWPSVQVEAVLRGVDCQASIR